MGSASNYIDPIPSKLYGAGVGEPLEEEGGSDETDACLIHEATFNGTTTTHVLRVHAGGSAAGPVKVECLGQNAGSPYIAFNPPILVIGIPWVVTVGVTVSRLFYTRVVSMTPTAS